MRFGETKALGETYFCRQSKTLTSHFSHGNQLTYGNVYQSQTDIAQDGAHLSVLLSQMRYVSCGWGTIADHQTSSLITMAGSKFCHWCEMGFKTKSTFHADSCRFKLKAVKRKRESPKEVKVRKFRKRLDHYVAAMPCRRQLFA